MSSQVTAKSEEEEKKIATISTVANLAAPSQKAKMHPDVFKVAESEFDD